MATNDYAIACNSNKANTALDKLCQDIGAIKGYIVCPWSYEIDTAANAKLEATWITGIQAPVSDRIYPFPEVFLMEDNSEEAVYQEGSISSLFVRDGKVNYSFTHESSRYKHAALKTHSNQKVSVYLIDQQGRIHGVSSDGVKFEAINLATFTVEKLKINNGTDATTTKVTMIFDDSLKFQLNPAIIKPADWNANDLEGLCDVLLTESGTPTLSEVIIDAEVWRTGDPVLGFSETPGEDWTVKNASGVEQSPTDITDNGDGTYTFSFGTPLTAGTYTFNLLAPNLMTTKGYESKEAVSVTLS